jgi:hypothetical protein
MALFAAADLQRQKTKLSSTLVLVRNSLRDPNAVVRAFAGSAPGTPRTAQTRGLLSRGETLIAAMATIAGAAWRFEHESAGTHSQLSPQRCSTVPKPRTPRDSR